MPPIKDKLTFAESFRTIKQLFCIAWRADARLISGYYACVVLAALCPLAVNVFQQQFIDYFTLPHTVDLKSLVIPLWITLILAGKYLITASQYLLGGVLGQTYLDYVLRYRMQSALGYLFHKKLSSLDIQLLEDAEIQSLIAKTKETYQWRTTDLLRIMSYALSGLVSMTASLALLLPFGWYFPLVLGLSCIPRLYLRMNQGVLNWSMYGSGAPQIKKFWYFGWLLTSPQAVPELKIFRSAPALLQRYKELQDYLFELNRKPLRKFLRTSWIPLVFESAVLFALAYTLLPALFRQEITLGQMTLFMLVAEQFTGGVSSLVYHLGSIYEDSLFASHFFQVMNLPTIIKEKSDAIVLDSRHVPEIEFRNVSFQYPNGHHALRDVSFRIPAGQAIAFVGNNGAGKSTIIKLLCRFYEPSAGQIYVNGHALTDVSLDSWYSCLGTLFQKFVDFHFSVKDNIKLGAPHIDDDQRMLEAARHAGIHEFVQKLPQQYDTMLGKEFENGEELSWGQWQKLAIARAFYQRAPVLILDEPTSAVDAEAEAEIFENLRTNYQGKSLIFVSHRFSTVRNADHIIVIEEGKLIEEGSHSELLKLGGRYAAMFGVQAKGYA